ncbi:microsomal triglyceride transfer protein large subunit isoform X2 [Parasteatoda tepidariorum]|uniref:microsomal triglyceride transfer protein large subunit isoform X2 n=1 Tax=Parasteatoda tepidariorum TaxID=114398 RepID=UPI001C71D8FE|nr:microsomal triglyceride transfer protein large subunit isoform X2 [Parasteatoda tepidariorum]
MWIIFLMILSAVVGHSLLYETGVSYKYSYQFTILLNEDANITSRTQSLGRNVGYRVSSEFILSPIWQSPENPKEKLLKLELLKPTLHVSSTMHSNDGINRHWSKLDNLSYPPIYIHWNDGIVKKVYVLPDSPSMINIKKGLASLFQIKVSNTPVKELDVSGTCVVHYKVHGSTIKKNKSNCERINFPLKNTVVNNELLSPSISDSSEMIINLIPQQSIIDSITGKEEVMMTLNLWKQAAVFVKNKFHVKYVSQSQGSPVLSGKNVAAILNTISQEMGSKLKSEPLEVTTEAAPCLSKCKSVRELVGEYGTNLLPEYIGELKSATGFLKFLDSFRKASKKELLMLFKDTDARILTQLLDVLAAAQTDDSLDVAFELIDFESKDIDIAERFLLCLAVVPNPTDALISKTLKLLNKNIKSEKLRSTILVALSSLMRTYCRSKTACSDSLIVQTMSNLFLKELQGCQSASCIMSYLLAFRNAALPQYLPVLLEFAKKGGVLGLMALEAMKDIGVQHFTPEIHEALLRIYNQFWPHQEPASRILAAELLMKSNPTIHTIGNLVFSLDNREQPEINSLLLSKIKNLALENEGIRSCVKEILRNVTYGNYHYMAQNGTSSSIINLLQASHDANTTYGINVEMRPTGMLKRTSFDLSLSGGNHNLHLMSLGLFVEGFGLTDEEQKENPEEASAGMQLSVLGVNLRPYIFFSGTGELMGLVWSGAGSEPTPAVQANFLLMDQTHSVVLQNGITVDLNLKGALSADVSGTVEVSMWNKNAHAVVKNRGALLVNGFCRVDTSFVESHVDFALGGNSVLNMVVNLDFAHKPMKICLQIDQPDYIFRHNVRKTETIPGSKHLIKTLKRRSMYFPGKSFNLHRKNSDSCRELLIPKKQKSSFW